jgi:glucose-1-phosphatase
MSLRRPALIFDFGNVVSFFDHARACESYGRTLGISGADFLQRLRDRGFSAVIEDYERGSIDSEEFSRAVVKLAGIEIPHEEFAAAWSDIFWLNPPVVDLVRTLKRRGYTLVLGSNTNALHAAHFRRKFAAELAHFDRLVLSFEVGHIKPAAGFYLACADAAHAHPGECLFIDDMPENVEGARAAGLSALRYHDTATLVADLRELGIEVDGPEG